MIDILGLIKDILRLVKDILGVVKDILEHIIGTLNNSMHRDRCAEDEGVCDFPTWASKAPPQYLQVQKGAWLL